MSSRSGLFTLLVAVCICCGYGALQIKIPQVIVNKTASSLGSVSASVSAVARHSSSQRQTVISASDNLAQHSIGTNRSTFSLIVECGRHLKKHPNEIQCPFSCPFLRAEPTRICEFTCVPAKDCGDDNPLTSFANPASGRCEACLVPGCDSCTLSSKNECAVCHDGFDLVDGTCKSSLRHAWHALYAFLLAVVLVLIIYVVLLLRRDYVNMEALRHGLDFRYLSSIRDSRDGSQWSLRENMQQNPRPAGLATMLHFRFMGMAMWWAFGIMIMFLLLQFFGIDRPKALRAAPENTFTACNAEVADSKEAFRSMEVTYFVATLVLYIVSTAGSIVFARRQRQTWEETQEELNTMGQFTLLARGFPILSGSEDVEKDFEEYLRQAEQLQSLNLVGVSVCWDYRGKKEQIDDCVEIMQNTDMQTAWGQPVNNPRKHGEESRRGCCDPGLRCIDTLLGVGDLPCVKSKQEEKVHEDIEAILDGLRTTNEVFLVFNHYRQAVKAKEAVAKRPLNYKGCTIKLHDHSFEPLTVLWDGFGCTRKERWMRLGVGWVMIVVITIVLDIFFYIPYVRYIISLSDVAGMTQGDFVIGTLLGLLISVCNFLIYSFITFVASKCGWTNSDEKMRFYTVQYTLAVLFNTVVDLWTVYILARGFALDEAIVQEAVMDTTMSPKAIAESPSLQRALYIQLLAYIFPSCLLLPFLIEPLVASVVPFHLGRALVGSRKDVSIVDAESCLSMNPYDLSRYGDVLVNIMLCCIMCAFTYPSLWTVWLYFLISMSVIYCWDKIRVLRSSFRSYFNTDTMELTAQQLMTMPCGILAACLAFRLYGAKSQGFLGDIVEPLNRYTDESGAAELLLRSLTHVTRYSVVWVCLATFFAHCFIHELFLKYFARVKTEATVDDVNQESDSPSQPDVLRALTFKTKAFEEAARETPATWFTTNPVHCLRSRYKYSINPKYSATENPPCTLYQIGKPFMIKENPKIGVYFTFKDRSANIPTYEERNERLSWSDWFQRWVAGHGHKHVFHLKSEHRTKSKDEEDP